MVADGKVEATKWTGVGGVEDRHGGERELADNNMELGRTTEGNSRTVEEKILNGRNEWLFRPVHSRATKDRTL